MLLNFIYCRVTHLMFISWKLFFVKLIRAFSTDGVVLIFCHCIVCDVMSRRRREMPAKSVAASTKKSVAKSTPGGGGGGGGGGEDAGNGGTKKTAKSWQHKFYRYVITNSRTITLAAAFGVVILFSIVYMPSTPESLQHAIVTKQYQNNGDTRGSWRAFDTQRGNITSKVSELLTRWQNQHTATPTATDDTSSPPSSPSPSPSPRVLVVGAGNTNDIDLLTLIRHSSKPHLHLVDIDLTSLSDGVERQLTNQILEADGSASFASSATTTGPATDAERARISMQRADLTGVLELVRSWPVLNAGVTNPQSTSGPARNKRKRAGRDRTPPTIDEIKAVIETIERRPPILISTNQTLSAAAAASSSASGAPPAPITDDQRFDVVVSTCVLSQLISGLHDGIAPTDTNGMPTPRSLITRLVAGLRAHHLQVINTHLRPNTGHALLFTDMISSLTYPALTTVPAEMLSDTMRELVTSENFFHGTNPHRLINDLQKTLGSSVAHGSIAVHKPWLWHFTNAVPPRTYLVYAIGWQTVPDDSPMSYAAREAMAAASDAADQFRS